MLALEIALDQIKIPAGRRAVDPGAVTRLKQSIADFGLQHSITVAKRDDAFVLVAGAHRVAAYRELGMERISANVIELTSLQARLLELDENLARNNFTPAERKSATARRKAIYEELHPEARPTAEGGEDRRKETRRQLGDETVAERFTKQTAEATGLSERTVQRDAQHGRALGAETLDKIARSSLDSEGEIGALAKLPAAERESLIERAAAGEGCGDCEAAYAASGGRCGGRRGGRGVYSVLNVRRSADWANRQRAVGIPEPRRRGDQGCKV